VFYIFVCYRVVKPGSNEHNPEGKYRRTGRRWWWEKKYEVTKKCRNPFASYQKVRDKYLAAYNKRLGEEEERIAKLRTDRKAKDTRAVKELDKKVDSAEEKLGSVYLRQASKFKRILKLMKSVKDTQDKLKKVGSKGSKILDKLLVKYESDLEEEKQDLYNKVLNFEPLPKLISSKDNKTKFKWLLTVAKEMGVEVKKAEDENKDEKF